MMKKVGWFTLAFLMLGCFSVYSVYGYDGPVNITAASVNDTRVNPSDPVTWTVGPVYNGTTGNPVGNGFALDFDGNGDYVQIGTDASLNINVTQTIECWINLNQLPEVGKLYAIVFKTTSYGLRIDEFGHVGYFVWGNSEANSATTPITANRWQHIVWTYDGANHLIYVNGTSVVNNAVVEAIPTPNTDVFYADDAIGGVYVFTNGTIDEARIYNRTLGTGEIAYSYQNKVPLDQTGLVLWTNFDTNVQDQTANGNDGTINGDPQYVRGIRGKAAMVFDGDGDYIQIGDDASLDIIGDLSIVCWVNPIEKNQDVVNKWINGNNQAYSMFLHGPNGLIGVGLSQNGIANNFYYSINPINVNNWNFIGFVYDASEQNIKHYLNGIEDNNQSTTENAIFSGNSPVHIATAVIKAYFNGTIDELRIYNRTLTSTEIWEHYNGIYSNETGLVLHVDFDNNVVDQSGNGNNGSINGDPEYSDGWAFCPLTSSYNGTSGGTTVSLVNSTTGIPISNLPSTAPPTWGNYTALLYPPTLVSTQNITYTGFIVDQYNITINAVYTENEEDLYTLVTATGESLVDGHKLGVNDTLIIEGETYTYSTQLGYFYGSYTRTTPGTLLVDTLTSMLETSYGITNGALNNTITLTWTTGTITRMEENIADGDWIGMILDEYTYTMGTLFFWTALMAILSIGFYNVGGVYVALFAWIMGWGVFSGLVHGQAQIIGYIFIVIGFGLAVVKLALDRRTT